MTDIATDLLILLWLLACAITDWRARRIPNGLTVGFLLLAAAVMLLGQRTLAGGGVLVGLLGLGMAVLLTLPGFVLGRLGGGDVKLLAALGLATSVWTVLLTFIGATVVLLVSSLAARAGLGLRSAGAAGQDVREWPFGPALLAGYVAALAVTPVMFRHLG